MAADPLWDESPLEMVPPLTRLALAGIGAGLSYLVAMAVDERLLRVPTDDLVLLGGFVSRQPARARLLGLVPHFAYSVLLAIVYALSARPRLSGAPWARGVLFATAENAVLWPLILVLDRVHPSIRSGRLPSYNRAIPWLQGWLRHAVFGAVLGVALGEVPPEVRRRAAALRSRAVAS